VQNEAAVEQVEAHVAVEGEHVEGRHRAIVSGPA
jgi:hypothetical protein